MFQKILVPFDGSKVASKFFPQVIELARTCNSQITLIHVCHSQPWEGTPEMIATLPEREKKACDAFLSKTAGELEARGIQVEWACVEGVPAREIIAYADEHEMDLIAMATHGRGEVAWVLGSVAEQVVTNATVPVLLYRVLATRPPRMKEAVDEEALAML